MKISKLDAARRQLETAIRLYFSEADPISIHTLTAAAHTLLSDLNKSCGGSAMLTEFLLQHVRPDKVKEAKRRLRSAANFFKHADRDPEHVQLFDLGQTEFMLLDACVKYRELTGELVPVMGAYFGWFWLGPGAQLIDVSQTKSVDRFREAFRGQTKGSFFRDALAMATKFDSQAAR